MAKVVVTNNDLNARTLITLREDQYLFVVSFDGPVLLYRNVGFEYPFYIKALRFLFEKESSVLDGYKVYTLRIKPHLLFKLLGAAKIKYAQMF